MSGMHRHASNVVIQDDGKLVGDSERSLIWVIDFYGAVCGCKGSHYVKYDGTAVIVAGDGTGVAEIIEYSISCASQLHIRSIL